MGQRHLQPLRSREKIHLPTFAVTNLVTLGIFRPFSASRWVVRRPDALFWCWHNSRRCLWPILGLWPVDLLYLPIIIVPCHFLRFDENWKKMFLLGDVVSHEILSLFETTMWDSDPWIEIKIGIRTASLDSSHFSFKSWLINHVSEMRWTAFSQFKFPVSYNMRIQLREEIFNKFKWYQSFTFLYLGHLILLDFLVFSNFFIASCLSR